MATRTGGCVSGVGILCGVLFFTGILGSPAWAQGTGNGLFGEYYDNINFTGARVVRADPTVNFDWGAANPPAAGFSTLPTGITAADTFSIRWRGWVEAPATETFTFTLTSDDGSRLYFNGTRIIDNWRDQGPTPMSATFAMTAGQRYPIMVEYYENGGGATVKLEWTSPSTPLAVVPQARLYSSAALAAAPTLAPNGGIEPLQVTLATSQPGAGIHYTLDGTDPGISAPIGTARLYTGPFTLNMSYTRVRARTYAPDVVPSDLVVSNVFSPLVEPIPAPPGVVQGVYARYFHLPPNPPVVPNFDPMVPQRRGLVPNFGITLAAGTPARDRNDLFGFKLTGYILIPAEGMWTFSSGSDDGSKLYVGPYEVVNNDGLHGAPGPNPNGTIALKVGLHPITVVQFESGGGEALTVQWQGPGMTALAAIPNASLFAEPAAATPTATPPAGPLTGPTLVTLNTTTPGSTIYYTLDGSAPDPRSHTASGSAGLSFTIAFPTRVRAVAVAPGFQLSDVADVSYTALVPAGPLIDSVTAAGVNAQAVVVFDRAMNVGTTGTAANYVLSNGATVSAAVPLTKTPALRAYWRFDETSGTSAADSTPNANAGTHQPAAGGPTPDTVNVATLPFVNPASLAFDGTDDFVQVPVSPSLDLADRSFTVSVWVRPTDATARALINNYDRFNDPATAANEERGWRIDLNSSTAGANQAGNVWVRLFDGTDTGQTSIAAGIVANAWQHLAVRVDRGRNRITVFRDGTVRGTADFTVNLRRRMNVTARPLLVGAIGNATMTANERFFAGNVDDLRIYATPLSDSEVAALSAGHDEFSSAALLTTSALDPATLYTLTVSNVRDLSGAAIDASAGSRPFRFYASGSIAREAFRFDPLAIGTVGIGGIRVPDLVRAPAFPNSPSEGNLPALFESATNIADNFGTRMRGYFIPATTGWYRFASATDDGGQLYLSPNEDPTNKVLVSFCAEWAPVRGYLDPDVAQSIPIQLTVGRRYYVELMGKEGGGGDNHAVAYRILTGPGDTATVANNTAPIAGAELAPFIEPLALTAQPRDLIVMAGQSVTLSVAATGSGPRTYQWRRDGTNIANATSFRHSIPSVTAAAAGIYSVVITSGTDSVTSSNAVVSVINPPVPTLASVTPSLGPAYGGQSLTISGSDFLAGQTGVTLGGTAARNLYFTPDGLTIYALTAPRAPGGVDVVASTSAGAATAAGAYTYHDSPTVAAIASVPPNADGPNGPVAGGQPLAITGTGFVSGQTTVTFGGAAATVTSIPDPSTINVTAPAAPAGAGAVAVVVTTPFGTFTLTNGYTYHDPPTVTSISPADGPSAGGDSVTLAGANYVPNLTRVAFDTASAAITGLTPSQLVISTPPHSAGSVAVILTTPGGQATTSYSYHDPPTISAVTPNAGPSAGGRPVTVTGANFVAGQTSVTFGGASATVLTVTPTEISLTSPPHAAGLVNVVVTTPGPGQTVSATNAYQYFDAPTVALISPSAGSSAGGQTVTLTGTNFLPGQTVVTFRGVPGGNVSVAPSGTSLLVTTPPGLAGGAEVAVITPGGTAAVAGGYVYHDPPTVSGVSPSSGTTQGGQTLTITGSNFVAGQTGVSIGGAAATNVVVNSSGSLTVTSPAHPTGTVDVVVTTPGGTATASAAYTYSGPFIGTVSPAAGPVAGGQTVTIGGTGFVPGSTTVTLGGTSAAVTSATATSINITTPAGSAPGTVDVTVTTPDGTYTASAVYSYVGAPTIAGISPTRGPAVGGATVTIDGASFAAGNTAVTFGGTAATVTAVTFSQIVVTTPPHAPESVDVVVTTFGNQSATAPAAYTYVAPPTVTSIVPGRGSTAGGQSITIRGTRFEPGQTTVSLGGSPAADVLVDPGETSLTAVTGAHGPGTVSVVVTTFGLQSGTLTGAYTYVDPATATDLSLAMTASTLAPGVGQEVTFVVTLSNSGQIDGTGIQVTDLLPSGLTLVTAAPSQGTYSATTGVWNVGTLAQSSGATLSLVAAVDTTASVTNRAEVTASDVPDLDSTAGNGVTEEDDQVAITLVAALTISTPGPLSAGTSGAYYYQPFRATGGVSPYRWSLAGGTLPLNLDPLAGIVSGTAPDVSVGTDYTFTLSVSDAQDPAALHSQTFTITVNPATSGVPVVKTQPAPFAGTVGLGYSHFFTAIDGRPPYTWTVSAGTMPPGTTLNSRTGELAGTPTNAGTFGLTIRATDSLGQTSTQVFSLAVNPNPVLIETSSLPGGSVTFAYSASIQSSGGIGPNFTWSVASGSPPVGLSLSGTGRTATLSGTPGASGTYSFGIRVSDASQPGVHDTRSFSLLIADAGAGSAAASVTTSSFPTGTVGRPFSAQLSGVGGTSPYAWEVSSGRLPAGVSLNATTGALAGRPSEDGYFPFTVRLTGAGIPPAVASRALAVVVAPALSVVTASPLRPAIRNESYFEELRGMGGVPPYRWSLQSGTLPAGMSLSSTSGALSGLVTGASSTFTLAVADVNGASTAKLFTLNVVDPAAALTVSTASLPRAEVGVPYSIDLVGVGGVAPYSWSLASGTLPLWGSLEGGTGKVSGVPDASGSFALTFQTTDSSGPPPSTAMSNALTLETILALGVTSTALPNATETAPYTATLGTSGAVGAVHWTVLGGTLPDGLALQLSTGIISGTPEGRGTFPLRLRATDSLGRTAQGQVLLLVERFNPSGSIGSRDCGVGSTTVPSPARIGLVFGGVLVLGLFLRRRALRGA